MNLDGLVCMDVSTNLLLKIAALTYLLNSIIIPFAGNIYESFGQITVLDIFKRKYIARIDTVELKSKKRKEPFLREIENFTQVNRPFGDCLKLESMNYPKCAKLHQKPDGPTFSYENEINQLRNESQIVHWKILEYRFIQEDLNGNKDLSPFLREINCPNPKLKKETITAWKKVKGIKELAVKFEDRSFDPKKIKFMSDEDAIIYLSSLRQIGRWSAEMILLFTLNRPDIWPVQDIGLLRSISNNYKKKYFPPRKFVEILRKRFSPYCSVATWYLWRSIDDEPIQY